MWTAWPVEASELPPSHLVKRIEDDDEKFTFRKVENDRPSTMLQEEIMATILRFSKQRFDKHQSKQRDNLQQSIETEQVNEASIQHIKRHSFSSSSHDGDILPRRSSSDRMDIDSERELSQLPSGQGYGSREASLENIDINTDVDFEGDEEDDDSGWQTEDSHLLEPVFSIDDDESDALLRPHVRHMLSKLDEMLIILQNSRLACLRTLSDSEGSDDASVVSETSSSIDNDDDDDEHEKMDTRHAPQDETNIQDNSGGREGIEQTEQEKDAAFEAWLARGQAAAQQAGSDGGDEDTYNDFYKWKLRDWSEVIGAASLAGLPTTAVRRAAQRCATLFGQGVAINTIPEVSASKANVFESTEYQPEPQALSSRLVESSETDSSDDQGSWSQRRIASRQASLSRDASTDRHGRLSNRPSPARSNSLARSSSQSSMSHHFCPIQTCQRAVRGFGRKANLLRHMRTIHPEFDEAIQDIDSDDELNGAVHVDGFLRRINPGKGWRGRNLSSRERRRSSSSTPATPKRAGELSRETSVDLGLL